MEAKLRETKKRQADDGRKAAERVREEMEEAEIKRNEYRQRTEDAKQRNVKLMMEEKLLRE